MQFVQRRMFVENLPWNNYSKVQKVHRIHESLVFLYRTSILASAIHEVAIHAEKTHATSACNFGDGFKINPEYLTKFKNPAQIACFLRVVCMFWWCFGLNLARACNKKQWSVEICKTHASNTQLWGRFQNQPQIPDKIQKPCKSCTFFARCLHVLVMFWCKSR